MTFGILQIFGWLAAIAVAMASLEPLAHRAPINIGGLFMAIMGGALNHAIMAIGLAVLDLVDIQMKNANTLIDILRKLTSQSAQRVKLSPPELRNDPPPVSTSVAGVDLLEPEPPIKTPSRLVISGDVKRPRPLNESDLARLEQQHKEKYK
jgi:hypothetical protein